MVTIRQEYRNTVIGFNNSGIVLHRRSQEDLIDLALLAHNSGDPYLLMLFDKLPSADALKKQKMEGIILKQTTNGETKTK